MPIITLTSDFGDLSYYHGIVKGVILSLYPSARIVDLCHNVPSFDIMEAAYLVKHAFSAFPPGSIHLLAVDPEQNQSQSVVMRFQGHYFVGADNGVMSLICEGKAHECVRIENEGLQKTQFPKSFRAAGVFAPTAAFLASGGTLEEVGEKQEMRDLRWGDPSSSHDSLRGKIIHIDAFGNAITNIRKNDFLEIRNERNFEIFIRSVRLKRIVTTYSDVAKGDHLAIFGKNNQLEIAMREASAASLLGLKVHDMITIEFK